MIQSAPRGHVWTNVHSFSLTPDVVRTYDDILYPSKIESDISPLFLFFLPLSSWLPANEARQETDITKEAPCSVS